MDRRVGLWIHMLVLLVVLGASSQCNKLPETQAVIPTDHASVLLTSAPSAATAIASEPATAINTPIIERLSDSPTFTQTLFDDRWLSQFDEQYIYLLTASDIMLDVSTGIRTIWRFSLQDGSYEKLAAWSLSEAEDLTARLADELEAEFCSHYVTTQPRHPSIDSGQVPSANSGQVFERPKGVEKSLERRHD